MTDVYEKHRCDICGKQRAGGNHAKCSRQRQQFYANQRKEQQHATLHR